MELTTIDTNNYAAMAKAMGIANEALPSASRPALSLVCVSITHLSWVRQR